MTSPATAAARTPSAAAVWAPWLAAPFFALLPIGGCGLAGQARSPIAGAASGSAEQATPVVPVVRPSVRQVAWDRPAN